MHLRAEFKLDYAVMTLLRLMVKSACSPLSKINKEVNVFMSINFYDSKVALLHCQYQSSSLNVNEVTRTMRMMEIWELKYAHL